MKHALLTLVFLLSLARPALAGVTLAVTHLGGDRWAVWYEADIVLWSGGFIIDGATAFAFAGIDANGDPSAAVNATYDPDTPPKALPGSVIGQPMPSLLVNPHGGFANASLGPTLTRVDLGVATVPGGSAPTVRYSAIEAIVPNLWAGTASYISTPQVTIAVGVPIPAFPSQGR